MNRETKQRDAILRFLRNSRNHPTADFIYEEVKKNIPRISKGTVYRNLRRLEENGEISALNLNGTVSRYEVKQDNHYHFRCDSCGKVVDVDEQVDNALDMRVARRTGFMVLYHQTEFRGLCKDCQR